MLDISVLILTHNSGTIVSCLKAISCEKFGEVIVMNNGGESKIRKERFPWVRFIEHEKNLGCVGGRNHIAKFAKYGWFLFLDDDQFVSPGAIERLFRAATENNHDIVGCVLNEVNENGIGKDLHEWKDSDRVYLGGGGLLVRRDVWEYLGGLDQVFSPAYCSDVDFYWRAKEAGYSIGWLKDHRIQHAEHRTMHTQKTFDHDDQYIKSHSILQFKWPDRLSGIAGFANKIPEPEKKRILFIADTPDWAVARLVDVIAEKLSHKYRVDKTCFIREYRNKAIRGYIKIDDINFSRYDFIVCRSIIGLYPEILRRLMAQVPPERVAVSVESHHGYDDDRFIGVFNEKLKCCKHIHAISDRLYKIARSAHIGHKVYFTPQGVDTNMFFNVRTKRNERLTIGWAGNASHGNPRDHKRFYEIILPVFRALKDEYNFRFAAKDVNPDVVEEIRMAGHLIDEIPYDGMCKFYNSVDVYLNASHSEAIASTTCEAIACGTPVVSTDVGYAMNLFVGDINGVIVRPDVGQFIAAIRYFSLQNYDRIFMLNNHVVNKILSWDRVIHYTERAIENGIESA